MRLFILTYLCVCVVSPSWVYAGGSPAYFGTFKFEPRGYINDPGKSFWIEDGPYIDFDGPHVSGQYLYLNRESATRLPSAEEYVYRSNSVSQTGYYRQNMIGTSEAFSTVYHFGVFQSTVIYNWVTGDKEVIQGCNDADSGGRFSDVTVDDVGLSYIQSGPATVIGRYVIVKGFSWSPYNLYAVCVYNRDDKSSYVLTDENGEVFRDINALHSKKNGGSNLYNYRNDGYKVYNLDSKQWSSGDAAPYPNVTTIDGNQYPLHTLQRFSHGAGTTYMPGYSGYEFRSPSPGVLEDGGRIYDLKLWEELQTFDPSIVSLNLQAPISALNRFLFYTEGIDNSEGRWFQAEFRRDNSFKIDNGVTLECSSNNKGLAMVSLEPDEDLADVRWFLNGVQVAAGFNAEIDVPFGKNRISYLAQRFDGGYHYSSARVNMVDSVAPTIDLWVRGSKGEIIDFVDKGGMNELRIDYRVNDSCDPDVKVDSSLEVLADNDAVVRMQATSEVVSVESNNFRVRVNAEDKFGNRSSVTKIIYAR